MLHHSLIEVLATKMSVAVGRKHLEHTVVDGQESYIKGSAAQVEHKNVLFALFLVKTVSNSSGSPIIIKKKP